MNIDIQGMKVEPGQDHFATKAAFLDAYYAALHQEAGQDAEDAAACYMGCDAVGDVFAVATFGARGWEVTDVRFPAAVDARRDLDAAMSAAVTAVDLAQHGCHGRAENHLAEVLERIATTPEPA